MVVQHFNLNAFCQVVVVADMFVNIYIILPLATKVKTCTVIFIIPPPPLLYHNFALIC